MYSQTCSNGSYNIHSNFPALMNDGRNIKQNINDTYYENVLKTKLNIKNMLIDIIYKRYRSNYLNNQIVAY